MATRAKTEMRGFVFIIFFSFLLFQIHFQIHFKKHFEILLNFSQTTQVNKNWCKSMNAQQVAKSYDKFYFNEKYYFSMFHEHKNS